MAYFKLIQLCCEKANISLSLAKSLYEPYRLIVRLNLPSAPNQITGPLFIAVLCTLAWFFEKHLGQYLSLNQSGIAAGYYWSFITANLVHTNTAHLLLNLGGLSLLWAIHGYSYTATNYLIQFLCFSLFVTLGMAFLSNNFAWYVGLSGVLHGTFVVGAYQDIRHRVKFGWWLMLGVWIKILYEQFIGADENLQSLIEAQVAVDAHLYGAIAGSIWVCVCLILSRINRSTPKN